jgi:hypothetical protein
VTPMPTRLTTSEFGRQKTMTNPANLDRAACHTLSQCANRGRTAWRQSSETFSLHTKELRPALNPRPLVLRDRFTDTDCHRLPNPETNTSDRPAKTMTNPANLNGAPCHRLSQCANRCQATWRHPGAMFPLQTHELHPSLNPRPMALRDHLTDTDCHRLPNPETNTSDRPAKTMTNPANLDGAPCHRLSQCANRGQATWRHPGAMFPLQTHELHPSLNPRPMALRDHFTDTDCHRLPNPETALHPEHSLALSQSGDRLK